MPKLSRNEIRARATAFSREWARATREQADKQTFEKCYRKELFTSDRERVEFLFALYEQLASPLLPAVKKSRCRPHTTP